MAIEDPAERVKTLYKMLELQPESASKGHLFTEYRRDLMSRTMHEGRPAYSVEGKRPEHAFEGSDLAMNRRPDDVVQIEAQVEDQRVCIRALDKLEVQSWLAETFESTMHLARIAKPNRTNYLTPGKVPAAFAPWWEYGDIIADERAGYPALSFVGYAPPTRTIEYAGFCTNTDIAKGGPDPRHVLIREIHEIRSLLKAKKDREGRPVDTVRVVFAEEWMARRERRPLLDVGARVFFMDRKTGADIEIKD